ncbi:MAG: universal stress protein [Candidatus Binataceae bacterium]
MSQLFQKILCPIDYDDQFAAALDLARRVAEQTGGRVCVLHVVSVDAEADRGYEKGETLQLEKLAHERLDGRIGYEFVVRTGPAAAEVVNAAKEFGSDLIVIPTHGRLGFKRLFLGNVAERVIREATVPVLTLRTS